MEPVLIDTSVIIGVLRMHENALRLAEKIKGRPKAVTDGVIGELLAGARNKQEFYVLLRHLQDNFMWLGANDRSSRIFREILIKHGPHRGVHLVDYQIAASAIAAGMPLCTLNKKHVSFIDGLEFA
ncbi:MAG: PIN domain-containing protein [Flavobacteriales bacterium]|nr:PIN domain-containing protein [Flavobacteriales bacterium]